MYYLLTADELGAAIDQLCKGTGAPIDPYKNMLRLVLSRLEGMLGVSTLVQGTFVDTFEVTGLVRPERQSLRLTNAFLPKPVTLNISGTAQTRIFTDDDSFDFDQVSVDTEMGIVKTGPISNGVYKVTYLAGFDHDENGYFVGVPQWLKDIAIHCVTLWFRMGPKTITWIEGVGYSQQVDALVKEIATRLYERYQRPRAGVIWGESLTYV